jgi:hypothetical protein
MPKSRLLASAVALGLVIASSVAAQVQQARSVFTPELERRITVLDPKVTAWRRDIHQRPELGNRPVLQCGRHQRCIAFCARLTLGPRASALNGRLT